MTRQELKNFKKERNEAFLTFDLKIIRQFFEKYKDVFMFSVLPPDKLLYADAMRTILDIEKSTGEQKERARAWLKNEKLILKEE